MENYITIQQFSALAGVSRQAIYQRLDKDLQKYCKVVDNKKMLNIEGLELFVVNEVVKQVDKVDKKVDNLLDKKLTDESLKGLEIKENYISDLTKNLDKQLTNKDKQFTDLLESKDKIISELIKNYDKQLSAKDMQIAELTQTLREMNKNNQFLLAKDNPTLINQTQNNGMEVVVVPSESPLESSKQEETDVVKQKVKKSIFDRIFKR